MQENETELTEEEKLEALIQERIQEAVAKEQRIIAVDQFYREGLMALAQKVNAGIYDPYIYQCATEEYDKFKKENPLQARKKRVKGKEWKKDE
jgi:hypothetical protein